MSKHTTISPQEAADRFASSSRPMRTATLNDCFIFRTKLRGLNLRTDAKFWELARVTPRRPCGVLLPYPRAGRGLARGWCA